MLLTFVMSKIDRISDPIKYKNSGVKWNNFQVIWWNGFPFSDCDELRLSYYLLRFIFFLLIHSSQCFLISSSNRLSSKSPIKIRSLGVNNYSWSWYCRWWWVGLVHNKIGSVHLSVLNRNPYYICTWWRLVSYFSKIVKCNALLCRRNGYDFF